MDQEGVGDEESLTTTMRKIMVDSKLIAFVTTIFLNNEQNRTCILYSYYMRLQKHKAM